MSRRRMVGDTAVVDSGSVARMDQAGRMIELFRDVAGEILYLRVVLSSTGACSGLAMSGLLASCVDESLKRSVYAAMIRLN